MIAAPGNTPANRGNAMNAQAATQPIYSIPDFCRTHGISRTQTYREINGLRLTASKVGKRTVITAENAAAWRASLLTFNGVR